MQAAAAVTMQPERRDAGLSSRAADADARASRCFLPRTPLTRVERAGGAAPVRRAGSRQGEVGGQSGMHLAGSRCASKRVGRDERKQCVLLSGLPAAAVGAQACRRAASY